MVLDLLAAPFLWLDASATRYSVAAWLAYAGFLTVSLAPVVPARGPRWHHPALYLGLLGLAMLAFRWPLMAAAVEFNPDESQLLAGAITSWHRHQVWAIDMGYCGPGAFLPLTLPAWFGLPIDYLGGRIVAWLMTVGSVAFLWRTLRHFLHDRLARLLVLPMATFYILTAAHDFMRYSGEQVPQLCLAAALWAMVTAFPSATGQISRRRLLAAGLILGALPFTKLQAAPLGVLLGGLGLGAVALQAGRNRAQRLQDAAWLVGGALGSAGLALGSLAAAGLWYHFTQSYLVTGLAYAGLRAYPNTKFLDYVWEVAQATPGFAPFLLPAVAATLLALPFAGRGARVPGRLLLAGGVLVLGAYFVVWAPGRPSAHYLLFLVLPTAFLLALLVGGQLLRTDRPRAAHRAWTLGFLLLTVGPQLYQRCHLGVPAEVGSYHNAPEQAASPVAHFISTVAQPGDALTIWGWAGQYHVQTQLPQGTRESHTERQIVFGPHQGYFRARFLADLERERPTFFLDVIGEGAFRFTDRSVFAHDRWSALQVVINSYYRQVGELDNVRIFLRLDQIKARAGALQQLEAEGYR